MARSGSTDFNQNVGSCIRDALILLGVATPSSSIPDAENQLARRTLNRMLKAWNIGQQHLYTKGEGVIIFDDEVASYSFPSSSLAGGDVGVIKVDALTQTTIGADEAAAQTAITLTSSTGMSATDKIIIELDDGTRHETTIVSVDSATAVTITAALPSAASEANFVWSYPVAATQSNLFYFRELSNVRLRDPNGYEHMLFRLSRDDYYGISNKEITGTPSQFYLDDDLDNPKIYFYPVPDNIQYSCRFTFSKSLDDVDQLTDDIEIQPEWLDPVTYNLAVRLGPFFGKEDKVVKLLAAQAAAYLRDAQFGSGDNVDIQIQFPQDYD